jgi:uncharacterized membrane protein HdeD (DUF308 family)
VSNDRAEISLLLILTVIGMVLLCVGLSLFLVPFSLSSYQEEGWKSPLFISMIVSGLLLLICFAVYEKYFSKKIFFPIKLMKVQDLWLQFRILKKNS